MPRIQIAQLSPFAGIGKASGKPYNMLRVKAIVTSEDGQVELGELAFFEQNNRPLPRLVVGQSYEPVISFESEKGNLVPRIVDLKPIAVPSVSKVA
jgi:hypothetical protein